MALTLDGKNKVTFCQAYLKWVSEGGVPLSADE